MPYHLYITNKNYSSWSLRPWLLLRQLGIPFVEELRPLTSGSIPQPRMYPSPFTTPTYLADSRNEQAKQGQAGLTRP
jgi:hypothetical protein